MTIPKSYEALASDLASEKILSKTLVGQKEAYMMLADKGRFDLATWKQKACEAAEREAALRESLTDKREEYNKLGDRYDALQQRLTVAEQRAGDAIELLEVWRTWLGFNRASCDDGGKRIWDRIDAVVALKPGAEVDSWKQWSVGDTVEYFGSGDSREDCYSCMTIGNKYSITEAPDDFETMVVLDDDGDEISVTAGDFRRIKP